MANKEIVKINEDELREIVKNAFYKTLALTEQKDNLDISSLFKLDSIPEEELKQQYYRFFKWIWR